MTYTLSEHLLSDLTLLLFLCERVQSKDAEKAALVRVVELLLKVILGEGCSRG